VQSNSPPARLPKAQASHKFWSLFSRAFARTKLTPRIDASKGHAGAAILVEYVELITAPFEMFYEL
jgi:hypothetical protein